ncbi:helix-turn-helix transcriptional regulator [Rhodopirellula europaea]|uniref:helix-turn-helix transcriptional regulator n=1 Tax=Rhodopirellula europaea TaxID=1263866 RepID=UPI0036F1ADC4
MGCKVRTLRRLVNSGELPPPIRIRSLYRYQPEVIDEWIAAQASKKTASKGGRRR